MALILVTPESSDNLGSGTIPVIDLNADLGEHDGDGFSRDSALLGLASSANIACGEHAGSMEVMRRTVALARDRGVRVGAHPGYPDREGFGRRELSLPVDAIIAAWQAQLHRMAEACDEEGVPMTYVKPHGALYNRSARDEDLAQLLASATAAFDSSLFLLTLPECALAVAARSCGLRVTREAFVDRAYLGDGMLVPRDQSGAVISDLNVAAARAVTIARDGIVEAIDGSLINVRAESFCVHGDGEHALAMMTAARSALEEAGFTIRAFAS